MRGNDPRRPCGPAAPGVRPRPLPGLGSDPGRPTDWGQTPDGPLHTFRGWRRPMSADAGKRTFAVAITGASGALYAVRTLAALLERDCHIELVVSDYGRRLLRDELGDTATVDKLRDYVVAKYGSGATRGRYTVLSNKD